MYQVIGLQEIINTSFYNIILSKISEFSSKNEDVEDFIKNKACDYEKRKFCRTFLVFDEEINLVGYFTLALKTLFFNSEVSKNQRKRIHGITGDSQYVPALLIGQLSKNQNFNSITGKELLDFAIDMIYQVHNIVGGRICLVETLTGDSNKKVLDFYTEYGFKKLQKDKDNIYQQIYYCL